MWELISSNRRKSIILFMLLGAVLITLSYLFGKAFWPHMDAAAFIFFGLLVWLVLAAVAYSSGDSILLTLSHAREVTPEINPRLYNVVEEMKIAAGLPVMPKIFIIDVPSANAFATGRNLSSCAIAVTAGLLTRLNRDELQGVIAHEMSHIINRDILYMTFAGVTLGSISLLSYWFLRGLYLGGGSSRRFRSKSSGDARIQMIFMALAIIGAIVGPIVAQVLYFSISRRREYLADASAVRLTRYPEGLASALEKLVEDDKTLKNVNAIVAPMYIVNPVRAHSFKFWGLGRTHPPVDERIMILRRMAMGAGYNDYQKAYSEITGIKTHIIPKSGLSDNKPWPIKAPDGKYGIGEKAPSKRDLNDLLKALNQFVFLTCTCGLKIKIPSEFDQKSIACPRCGTSVIIPAAALASSLALRKPDAASISEYPPAIEEEKPIRFKRRGNSWETFTCICGKNLNISPAFQADTLKCSGCGRLIEFAA
jgi:heat shock protein HtpX